MAVRKTSPEDPSDTGKIEVYRDLEERVLKDAPSNQAGPDGRPGKSIIEAAVTAGDTHLLRAIASERKGLSDQQRQALLLLADLLDRTTHRRHGQH